MNKQEKIWEEQYIDNDKERRIRLKRIARELGVSYIFVILLYNRGYTNIDQMRAFLRYDTEDFHDPFLLCDMREGVERILDAIAQKQKIYIYGDYDVDGVTSVSTLYLYLTSLGADVGIKIPKRDGEGYGVSEDGVRAIAEDGAKLIITVDTGITANKEVELAKELGVDFVITDHHECHGEIPRACAVINPHRPDNKYPFCELAGVGVVFKTVCAIEIQRCRRTGVFWVEGIKRVSKEYCDLVAVGTIADVMPLCDENRLIVSLGLSKLSRGEGRPGLIELLDVTSRRQDSAPDRKVTSSMIGFGVAPRLNAAGRMSDALIAVELLLAEDIDEVADYTDELCRINKQRQEEENRIAEQAFAMLDSGKYDNDSVIILDSDTWQPGIIGIVSSRITEKYGVPSILVSFSGNMGDTPEADDDGKGSGRSIRGINLVDALDSCNDLLVKYGGHELAAGLTVKRGKIDELRRRLNEYISERMTEEMRSVSVVVDCELDSKDIDLELAYELGRLEPFGQSNPTPQFTMRCVSVRRVSFMGGGKHTRLVLEHDGDILNAVCFGVGEEDFGIHSGELVDIMFSVDVNEFRGTTSVQLIIHDIKRSEFNADTVKRLRYDYSKLKNGLWISDTEDIIPTREDCAKVYTFLRKEFRNERNTMNIIEILRELNLYDWDGINYLKLKTVFDIFNELQICTIEEIEKEIYRYDIYFNPKKVDIERSTILKRLRHQCFSALKKEKQ
ncbi:MAG: single-stranded-DNA-specific exonuclease RecJ [Clostridia bacterium]|nr:single-stranded-DNA-specific exonuclease RecJ [Clostridia bacterium]